MSVTLTPYGHLLYGVATYGGVQVGGFGHFDTAANRASTPAGTARAATYDPNSPVKA